MISDLKVAVFGGTGHYGQPIVKNLVEQGADVRILTRNPDKAFELFGKNIEIVFGDVRDGECIKQTLSEVSGVVICLSAASPAQIRYMKDIEQDAVFHVMDEMSEQGIQRLVYLSAYDLRKELLKKLKIEELGQIKLNVEERIRNSQLNWTILGCPPSFELFFSLLRGKGRKLVVPGGGRQRIACVSPQDVGRIACEAVIRKDLGGKRYRITGPVAYNFPEVADLITSVTGKTVKLITPPLFLINIISWIMNPLNPFLRFVYYSLKMMNNFPVDLANSVPGDHKLLNEVFDYNPVSLEEEIRSRLI